MRPRVEHTQGDAERARLRVAVVVSREELVIARAVRQTLAVAPNP
jgi:hypothetical protein